MNQSPSQSPSHAASKGQRPSLLRQLAAIFALLAAIAALVIVVAFPFRSLSAGLVALLGLLVAAFAGWFVVSRRGPLRWASLVLVVLGLAAIVVSLIVESAILDTVAFIVLIALSVLTSRIALQTTPQSLRAQPTPGRSTDAPSKAVVLMNPRSGGGKVERFKLEHEARERGIKPVVLGKHDDLRTLAEAEVAAGADALGMAGGDGSQAIVASIAAQHDLPFVCIPAGTRNHLALDLGVDRDDVVGALDAFTDGNERRIDLATVNGQVFVNNVSLGIYARIVQSEAYRDNKLGTAMEMLPDMLGPDAEPFDLHYCEPDGSMHEAPQLMMVSNNSYVLDRIGAIGSRKRLDTGQLGILALTVSNAGEATEFLARQAAGQVSSFSGWHEWSASEFTIDSNSKVEAGVDGEALQLDAPLEFAVLPRALRVRVAASHPGVSPAAVRPGFSTKTVGSLVRIAVGRNPAQQQSRYQ